MNKVFLICCGLIMLCSSRDDSNPALTIEGGKISGVQTGTPGVVLYKGIPYAAPPVGNLRWKAPQPVIPWEGIKIADKFGPASIQADQTMGAFYQKEFYFGDHLNPERSEDCLYLNVWTPASGRVGEKLPVAMWIHGGAYWAGYSHEVEFDGDAWAKRGVILVTINYRLGILGFMAHPALSEEDPNHVSGNYGILDQIAALKWIKNNIAQFGGDSDNVTIMGQSAGAGSVQSLVVSPLAKGLFHKAIIQSGGGLNSLRPPFELKNAEEAGKELFEMAGKTTLDEMRAIPANELPALLTRYTAGKQGDLLMVPNADGYVVPEAFSSAARQGLLPDIPFMIGHTQNDMGDQMGTSIADFCLLLDEQGHKPAYSYNFTRPLPGDQSGAFHSAELWYEFATLARSWRPFVEADYNLSQKVVDLWTNFAKYGDPNGKNYNEWKPFTKESRFIEVLDIK